MNKKTIEQLQAQMTALTAKFNQAFPGDKAPETAAAGAGHDAGKEPGTAEEFNALKAEIADLKKQVETFTAKDKTDTEKTVSVETVEALKTELSTLTESFNAALQEQPGTDGGDHLSGDDDLNQYI